MDVYDIQTRHLEALQAVVREGSFAKAADYLGFSQAAISQQIARLEEILGMAVLDRPGGRRAAKLTPAGRVILRHAETVLERVGALEQELEALQQGTGGRLVVGVFESIAVQLLPDIVREMRAQTPDLQISLVEGGSNEALLEPLHAGEIDVTFLSGPVDDPDIDAIELGTDPFVLMLAKDSPLAALGKNGVFPAAALRSVGLIGQHDPHTQAQIDDSLRVSGASVRYLFRTNDNAAVQAMVRSGLGPAIMPSLATDRHDPDVTFWELDPPIEPRTIVLALPYGGTRLPAAAQFAKLARTLSRKRLSARRRTR